MDLPRLACLIVAVTCGGACAEYDPTAPADAGEGPPRLGDARLEVGRDVRADAESGPAPVPVPLTGCLGINTAEVTIGGTQRFQMIIDTGSTTVAVAGAGCASCSTTGVSPLYAPGQGAIDREQRASSLFGTGDHGWAGQIYHDTIGFSGLPGTPMDLVSIDQEQSFFIPSFCLPRGYQGLFGLGPGAAALPGTDSYLERLAALSGLPDVFALRFCSGGGTLWLGGYEPAAATGPPDFAPLLPATDGLPLYTVELTGVLVGAEAVQVPAITLGPAVVDSGAGVSYFPEGMFDALTGNIGDRAAFKEIFPAGREWFTRAGLTSCTVLEGVSPGELDSALPTLTLILGGVSVEASATESYLTAVDGLIAGETCWIPGIATNPALSGRIIGTSFLRSRITVFDRENQRLGFARPGPCP